MIGLRYRRFARHFSASLRLCGEKLPKLLEHYQCQGHSKQQTSLCNEKRPQRIPPAEPEILVAGNCVILGQMVQEFEKSFALLPVICKEPNKPKAAAKE